MNTDTEINEDNQQKQQAVSGHVEPVVMVQALTLDDVRLWDFIGKTPAGREHYYNKELDIAAYISYRKLQFYFNRIFKGENYAAHFSDNFIV